MAPGDIAVAKEAEQAKVVGIVFPKYNKDIFFDVYDMDQATAYTALAENAFNYTVLQEQGVKSLIKLVEHASSFEVEYSSLEELDSFLTEEVIGTEHVK